jgi:hypothetical protein
MSFERIRTALFEPAQAHQALQAIWTHVKPWLIAGHRLHLEIRADTRSLASNRLLWQRLTEVSQQVEWHGVRMTPEEWKDVFSAARKQQRVVPSIDGTGFVVIGERTSQYTQPEMTEMLDLIEAFGMERGVRFRDHEVLEPV